MIMNTQTFINVSNSEFSEQCKYKLFQEDPTLQHNNMVDINRKF